MAEDNVVNQKVVLDAAGKTWGESGPGGDGSQAIAAVMRNHYDLVLMDVQMPEVDGLAATREIRKSPAAGTPARHLRADRARDHGVSRHLPGRRHERVPDEAAGPGEASQAD